jgi:glutathione-specific gamma-glutamylcyclotransferase
MQPASEPRDDSRIVITREALLEGSLLRRVRANPPPGMTVRSDAELEASLDEILAGHDTAQGVWLFAYGSLLWNPAIRFVERRPAQLAGWHRRYAFWLRSGRGSPEHPGLMLGLEHDGECQGIAYRIGAPARDELLLVWRREMFGRAYIARWVNIDLQGEAVEAITFIANSEHVNYVGALADEEAARVIARAAGVLGSCFDYLQQTLARLHEAGLTDPGLERIAALAVLERAGSVG